MARIKGGLNAKKKHNRVLKMAKGYRGARSKQYRVAKQSVMRALASSYAGRKQRKRQFRQLWIARINAAARMNGLSYSKFMHGLKLAKGIRNSGRAGKKQISLIDLSSPVDAEFTGLFIFDKFLFLDYNILNKTTGKDGCTPSAPGRYKSLVTKSSRYLDQRQGGYFLFFILRMATIKFAVAMMIINSSYVLIITTPFVSPPKQVEAALPSCLGKYTLLS